MIKFFRKIRYHLMEKNKTGKYFKYAIGEILLVVIGILIALSINNWNEQRIKDNNLAKIHERLIIDIDNDLRELSGNLSFWKDKEPIFKKVINDSLSADLFDEGLSRLLTTTPSTNLNKSGVQQLKTLNVKDELSLRIMEVYDYMENIGIIPLEDKIGTESTILVNIFRDNYIWFSEWMSKTIMKDNSSPELQNYFLTSIEYKNRVINGNQIIFNNYVPNLEIFIPILEDIRAQLTLKGNSNFTTASKKELEKYVGTYKVTKMELNGVEIENTDLFEISARENFLHVTPVINPNNVTYYYYTKDNTFYSTTNGQKATGVVQLDSASNVIGFKSTIESNQEKIVLFITKQTMDNKGQ